MVSVRRIIVAACAATMMPFVLFLWHQATGITGGDSGDLVAAAAVFGVPHPPGYPLYTLLAGLLIRIPLSTPAWNAALLSSIPHALTIGLLFLLSYRLTSRFISGWFTAAVLTGNYVFFMYSITPEVFALLNLMIVTASGLFLLWLSTGRFRYLAWLAFLLGLGMTHHHVLLFAVPAMVIVGWRSPERRKQVFRRLPHLVLCGLAGLLPYAYVYVAGSSDAIINWDRPVTIANFIRLITRADYGTFQSGAFYMGQAGQRLLQIKVYLELLWLDFHGIGIAVAGVGWWWLRQRHRQVWWYITLAICSLGPWFFFYAGFPLMNRFTLGTYERFLMPSYVFLSLLAGIGVWRTAEWGSAVLSARIRVPARWVYALLTAVLALYPVVVVGTTLWRFAGIRDDRTATLLGQNILDTVPPGSIILLGRDTPLFITQYVRYAAQYRPDTIMLHGTLLETDYYPDVIRKAFPQLVVPAVPPSQFVREFIVANRATHPVFANIKFGVDSGLLWVPYGLLYRLVPEAELPSVEQLLSDNSRLWQSYNDPRQGILSRYNHLMLADILDVYAASRNEFSSVLLKAQRYQEAKEYAQAAIGLAGDTQQPEAHTNVGLAELGLRQCAAALAAFDEAEPLYLVPNLELLVYRGVTYRDCLGDAGKAREYFARYENERKQGQTQLQP